MQLKAVTKSCGFRADVKQFNEDNKIERYLNEEELKRLLKVLHTNKNRTVCQIALFLLATGARLNEALSARWESVDKGNRVWRIPVADSKSRHMRSVPLNDSAIPVAPLSGPVGSRLAPIPGCP